MKIKFFIIIALLALICLVPLVSASAYVKWTNDKGQEITSINAGDAAYVWFDTLNNGNGSADYYTLHLWVKNSITNAWTEADEPFPTFQSRIYGQTHYYDFGVPGDRPYPDPEYKGYTAANHPAGAASFFFPFQENYDITCQFPNPPPFSTGGHPRDYQRWTGYAAIGIPLDTVNSEYKIYYEAYKYPLAYGYLSCNNETELTTMSFAVVSNATIAVTHRADSFSLGAWLISIGGDGLAYLVAAIIIAIFLIVPFFLMKTFNIYVEVFMYVLALGICYGIGVLGVAMLFILGLGAIAVYYVARGAV